MCQMKTYLKLSNSVIFQSLEMRRLFTAEVASYSGLVYFFLIPPNYELKLSSTMYFSL